MLSVCNKPLISLSNPGASGSVFFLTNDDQFIIKTVRKGEHNFMLRLLPGYYMNLVQNKQTLLPKFFGLFCYQNSLKQNIRFVVMNNLLPTRLEYGLRFDLKGSTKGRRASVKERRKKHPCFKDLDFMSMLPAGIRLDDKLYERLKQTLERDVLVLESFRIMDYSLLVGIHRIGVDAILPPRAPYAEFSDAELSPDEDGDDGAAAAAPHADAVKVHFDSGDTFEPAEDVGPLRVKMGGCTGAFEFVNGVYYRFGETSPSRPSYRHTEQVPHGNGILDGKTVFIFYDELKVRWTLCMDAPNSTATCLGFAPGNFRGPTDAPVGAWQLATSVDAPSFEQQPTAFVAKFSEAEAMLLAQTQTTRRRSMSFGTVTEQLGTADESSPDADDAYEDSLRGTMKDVDGTRCEVAVYLGIIDILQSFGVRKKLEHKYKSVRYDAATVSVHKPDFYRQRFQDFMCGSQADLPHVFVTKSNLMPGSSHSSLAGGLPEAARLPTEEVKKRIQGGAFGNPNWTPRSSTSSRAGADNSSQRASRSKYKKAESTSHDNQNFNAAATILAESSSTDDVGGALDPKDFGTPAHASTPDGDTATVSTVVPVPSISVEDGDAVGGAAAAAAAVEPEPGSAEAVARTISEPMPAIAAVEPVSGSAEEVARTMSESMPAVGNAPDMPPQTTGQVPPERSVHSDAAEGRATGTIRRSYSIEPDLPDLPVDDGDDSVPPIPADDDNAAAAAAVPGTPTADTSTWSRINDSTNDSLLFDPTAETDLVAGTATSAASSPARSSSDSPERDAEAVRAAKEKIAMARKSRQDSRGSDPELDEFMQLERKVSLPSELKLAI
mmetsp:Transcript_34847/g.105026  ORF Transcript_34847/g.105026 Transcript_34847/m.105026 type:complete len:834 (+) Transcript_34847:617-3118(+)